MSKTFKKNVSSKDLEQILSWFQKALDSYPLDTLDKNRLFVAFEEVVVNIINHSKLDQIDLSLTLFPIENRKIQVKIEDNAPSFNPLTHPIDDQNKCDLQDLPQGGLGLVLMKQCVDSISYERKEGKNILILYSRTLKD